MRRPRYDVQSVAARILMCLGCTGGGGRANFVCSTPYYFYLFGRWRCFGAVGVVGWGVALEDDDRYVCIEVGRVFCRKASKEEATRMVVIRDYGSWYGYVVVRSS